MDTPTTARDRDRLGLEVLTADECWRLIQATPIGRVAFVDAGEAMVFPVTHAVIGRRICFMSRRGSKLSAAEMAHAVSFEVDGWEESTHRGWSVLARGVGDIVEDAASLSQLRQLGVAPWVDTVSDGTWVQIRVDEISGRRVGGSAE